MGACVNTNGVPYSTVERVELSKAWLEESENAVVWTYENGAESSGEVAANFQARMSRFHSGGVGLPVVRDFGGLSRYYRKLSETVQKITFRGRMWSLQT